MLSQEFKLDIESIWNDEVWLQRERNKLELALALNSVSLDCSISTVEECNELREEVRYIKKRQKALINKK